MRDKVEALAIAQKVLDDTGLAIRSGDFEAIARAFALPVKFGTFDGEVMIDNVGMLAARFEGVRAHHRSLGVTDIVRNIIECDWSGEDAIHTTFQSRLLAGDTLAQAPYTTLSILNNIGGEWRCSAMLVAIPDSEKHNEALLGTAHSGDTK